MRRITGAGILCLLIVLPAPFAMAQKQWNGSASNSWSNPNNWTPIGAPGAGDIVQIQSTLNNPVQMDAAGATIASLQIDSSASLDITGGNLTVTGTCLLGAGAGSSGTLTTNDNSLTIGGALVLDNGTIDFSGASSVATVIDVTGNLTGANGSAISAAGGSGRIIFRGATVNFTNITFTPGSTDLMFVGVTSFTSAGQPIASMQIGSATLGATLTLADNLDVNGAVSVNNGGATTWNISNRTVNASANVTLTNLDTFTVTGSTFIFDGNTTLTSAGRSFNNIQIGSAAAGGILTLADTLDVNGAVTVTNFAATTWDVTNRTVNASANVTLTNLDTFTVTGSTFIFDGNTTLTSAGRSFNNIQIGSAAAGGILTLADTLDVNGAVTVTNFAATVWDITNRTVNASANVTLTNLDTFTVTGSTFIFDGNTTLTSAGRSFNNIQIGSAAAGGILTLADTLDVNGAVTVTNFAATTWDVTNRTVNASANVTLTNLDTFTVTGSTFIFDGNTTLTSAGRSFNNIQIGSAAAGGILTLADTLDVNGAVTVTNFAATTWDVTNRTVNASANVTLTNLDTFTVTGSTFIFDGNTTLTSAGRSFNNIQIGSAAAGGILTLADTLDVNGAVTVTNFAATTWDVTNRTVNASANVTLTNLDTFTVTGSTFIFDGNTTLTSAGRSFNNIQIGTGAAAGSLTLADNLDVNGTVTVGAANPTVWDITNRTVNASANVTLTNLDTFTVTGSTFIFDGNTTLTSAGRSFNNVQVAAAATLTQADAFVAGGTHTIGAGASHTAAGQNVTVTGAFTNQGTLFLVGSETVTLTMDTAQGTVSYYGNGVYPSLVAGNSYYNLTLNNTMGGGPGTWTLTGVLTVNGSLSVGSTGSTTFTTGNNNATIGGNYTIGASGTITFGTNTFTFTAAIAATVDVTPGGFSFSTFRVNAGANTVRLQGALTAAQDVTISGGTLNANNQNITVNRNWSNSGSFTPGTGTVTFASAAAATITGSTTFNNFTCTTAGKTIQFTAGTTQTVNGSFTVTGLAGSLVSLLSTVGGSAWTVDNVGNTEAVTYAFVQDSTAATNTITATTSRDNGGNTNWSFTATTLTWTGATSTNWNTGTNWDRGYAPNQADNATIANVGWQPATLATNTTIASLVLNAGATVSTNNLNLAATGTTTVNNGATLTGSNGTMGFTGAVTVTGTGAINGAAGAITLGSSVSGTGTLRGSSTTTSVAGDMTVTTFNANGGTLVVNGGGTQAVNGYTFNNLTINKGGGTVTSGGAWVVNGVLTLSAGTWDAATFTHQVAGNWDSSAITFTGSTSTIQLTGANPSVTLGVQPFNNLTVNNGAVLQSNVSVGGVLTVSSGALNTNGRNLSVTGTTGVSNGASITGSAGTMGFTGAVTVTGTGAINGAAGAITLGSSVSGTGTLRGSSTTTSVAGDMTVTTFNANGGTLVVNGGGAQAVNGYTFNNLTINKGGGTVTSGGAWVVNGVLTLSAGTWAPGGFVHQVAGNWNDTGVTFTPAAGTIQLTGAGPTITQGATNNFFNLTIGNGATMASAITVTGSLTLSGGIVNPGAFTHLIAGNWNDSAATFTPAAGTIQLTGAGPTITQGATNNFFNLTIGNGATMLTGVSVDGALALNAGVFITNAQNLSVTGTTGVSNGASITGSAGTMGFTGTVTVTGTGAINGAAGAITLGSSVSGTGTLRGSSTTTSVAGDMTVTTFNANGGTLVVNGGGAQAVNGYTFNNLTINKGGGTVTSGGAWVVNGVLTLSAGTWDAATFTHQVAGNWDSSAITFTGSTSTIQLTGANPSVTLGVQPFNNLTVNNGAVLQSNVSVGGVLTVSSGALNTNGRNLSVTGTTGVSNGASITGSAGTMGFTGAVTVTGTGAINGAAGAITLGSSVSGTGTLRGSSTTTSVAGDMTVTTFNANGGTLVVNGGGAQAVNGYTFNNLTINKGGGTVTSGGAWVVNGVLTLSAGTWDAATFTHQVAGNWDSSAITFTGSTSTIQLTGANPSVTLGVQPFNNLTVNNGAVLQSNVSVGGVLTVSSGALNTNGRNLSVTGTTGVSNGASITGSAGTMGFTGAVTVTGTGAINGAAGAITLGSSVSGTGTLRGSSTTTSVAGDMTVTTFNANGGTLVVNGGGAQAVNGYTFNNLTINKGGGTVTSGGAWVVNGVLTLSAGTWAPGGFVHQVAGNWNDTGVTFTPAAGTIQLTGAGPTITQGATNNFFNLTIGNGATMASAVSVDGALTVTAGTLSAGANNLDVTGTTTITGTLNGGSAAVTLAGNVGGAGTLVESSGTTSVAGNLGMTTFTANGGTVVLNGAAAQTTRGYAFNNLTINNTSGLNPAVSILASDLSVAGTFTHSAGTLNLNGRAVTVSGGATLGPTIQNSGGAADFSVAGPVILAASVSITTAGGTITFSSTVNGSPAVYPNLTLAAGAGGVTIGNTVGTGAASTSRVGAFTISSAATASLRSVFTVNAQAVTAVGGITLNGTCQSTAAGGTIAFAGPVILGGNVSVTTVDSAVGFSSTVTGAQTLSVSCGTATATISGTVNVSTLAITTGTVDVQANDFTIGSTVNSGTLALDGTQGTQAITAPDLASGETLYKGAAGGVIRMTDFHDLRIVSADQSFTSSGAVHATGNLTVGAAVGGVTTFTLGGALTVDGNLSILAQGSLDVNVAGSWGITAGGNWSNSGTFNPRSGRVTFTKPAGIITILGNNSWYEFWCSVPGIEIQFEATMTQTMVGYGSPIFRVQGSGWGGGQFILLNSTNNFNPAGPANRFNISVSTVTLLQLNFVWVDCSNASPVITTPPVTDVQLTAVAGVQCPGWIRQLLVDASYAEDSDANGKIDRVRAHTQSFNNSEFADFHVTVTGYTLLNGDTPASFEGWKQNGAIPHDEFHILLAEKPVLDTDATPSWTIGSNTSLKDELLGGIYFATIPAPPAVPTDAAPPLIGYTLAVADKDQVYVQFSEPVTDGGPLTAASFTYKGMNPQTVTPVGASGYLLTLLPASGNVTATEIVTPFNLTVSGGIRDAALNAIFSTTHRVSDLGLGLVGTGVMEPTWAQDQVITAATTTGLGRIDTFDGSAWLRDQDVTVTGSVHTNILVTDVAPVTKLWFDVDVPASQKTADGLWLPSYSTSLYNGLVPYVDPSARQSGGTAGGVTPFAMRVQKYGIPGADPEIVDGVQVEFLFEILAGGAITRDLFCARVINPAAADWYLHVVPWAFDIHEVPYQKGSVSILHNVINPGLGELVTLNYVLARAGAVTVNVFDLAGNLVQVLVRNPSQAAGDYAITWDGRNKGGRIVARGIYFMRLVGPGIDETRKVLVVR